MSSAIQILKHAWDDIIGGDFDLTLLSAWVYGECEVDSDCLTLSDIESALQDGDKLDWNELSFASSESLVRASVYRCSQQGFMAAVGLVVIIEYGVRRGFRDWERTFGFLLTVLSRNDHLPCRGTQIEILRWILCGNG